MGSMCMIERIGMGEMQSGQGDGEWVENKD